MTVTPAQCSTKKFLEAVDDAIYAERTSPVVKERLRLVVAGAAFHYGGDNQHTAFRQLWRKVKGPNDPQEVRLPHTLR